MSPIQCGKQGRPPLQTLGSNVRRRSQRRNPLGRTGFAVHRERIVERAKKASAAPSQ
jgi:hypothetical protein